MEIRTATSPLRPTDAPLVRVMKFGSSTLRDCEDVIEIARFLRDELASGTRIVAVVSALHGETDRLLAQARQLAAAPCPSLLPRHLLLGEEHAASAVALALTALGVRATQLSVAALQLIAVGDPLEAQPLGVQGPLRDLVHAYDIVVVPGFGGWCTERSQAVLLGRGGSDLTAVHAARALDLGEVTLIKDVDGIYSTDPKACSAARHIDRIGWREASSIAGRLVQQRALEAGERFSIAINIRSLKGKRRSIIEAPQQSSLAGEAA